jgi:hypothetical protein
MTPCCKAIASIERTTTMRIARGVTQLGQLLDRRQDQAPQSPQGSVALTRHAA